MKDNSMQCVISMFLIGSMFFGWLVMIAESPINRMNQEMDHTRIFNTMWAATVTMTTVGYGDMFPRTDVGRVIMIFCSIYGVVVLS